MFLPITKPLFSADANQITEFEYLPILELLFLDLIITILKVFACCKTFI